MLNLYQSKIFGNYVIKDYRSPWAFKWIISLPFLVVYPYSYTPTSRMCREIAFFRYWKNGKKVRTPEIFEVNYKERKIKREYVLGEKLSVMGFEGFKKLFMMLGIIHSQRWALGDTKPENFVYDPKNDIVYVIDAEQSIKNAREDWMAWDVILSLIFAGVYCLIQKNYEFEELLDQYLRFNDSSYIATIAYSNLHKIKSQINLFRLKSPRL